MNPGLISPMKALKSIQQTQEVSSFLREIDPIKNSFKGAFFTFLAMRDGDGFAIWHGQLFLQVTANTAPSSEFRSSSIWAGQYTLAELGFSVEEFLNSLLSGSLITPGGTLRFPTKKPEAPYETSFIPFFNKSSQAQQRQMELYLRGADRPKLDRISIDWELRSSSPPYDGLADLIEAYNLTSWEGDFHSVGVTAFHVGAINNQSAISGTRAKLGVLLAKGLDTNAALLGFRLLPKQGVAKRGTIQGAQFTWTTREDIQYGVTEMDVPAGCILQCFFSYQGIPQHWRWVLDPNGVNPLRTAYAAFDPELDVLKGLLTKQQGSNRGYNARDFESGVARALWMLGFSVVQVGNTPQTSDAPDILAVTPSGNVLVIECTTGQLKAENKLALLVERKRAVQKALIDAGQAHFKVLAIIVTAKHTEEVKADLEQAKKLEIVVCAADDIEELFGRLRLAPDPERLFEQAQAQLEDRGFLKTN